MDGILNIDKPWGKTSFSIVALVKRLSGERRVGHAGTLDPAATGVLPVCLGRGTRIVEFLMGAAKTYRAQIELGTATDTYDASGQITHQGDIAGINQESLEAALQPFRGLIPQTPPMYSAVKHHGQPLYKLARAGIEIERKSRMVEIYRLELREWRPPIATVEVECSKGTYIRSLAHDLGQALRCGAYLKSLVRSRYGVFDIRNAVSIPQLEEAFHYGYWQHFVYPVDAVLLHYDAIVVDETAEEIISKGSSLPSDSLGSGKRAAGNYCRAYSLDGRFLGILSFNPEKEEWHPKKVFSPVISGQSI